MTLVISPVGNITLASDGDTVVITASGQADSMSGVALDTNDKTGLTIINYGGISSSVDVGLKFTDGSTGSIINQASGYIVGDHGVDMQSSGGASLLNFGTITGFGTGAGDAGVYFSGSSHNDSLDNRGYIYGELYGVRDFSGAGSNTITNYGTIEGKAAAISINTLAGLHTTITNYGTLNGGTTAAIDNHDAGAVYLSNFGTIDGSVSLESSSALDADQVYNNGTITSVVTLGAGNDIYVGTKGTAAGVYGEDGKDLLSGGLATDNLYGGTGQDKLAGGGGNNSLTGGADADEFIFDAAFVAAGVDTIEDFTHGVDHIDLALAIFTKVAATGVGTLKGGMFFAGAHAHDANDRIIYNANNGWLIYDQNGSAAGGQHHFATLDAHLTLSAADFLIV